MRYGLLLAACVAVVGCGDVTGNGPSPMPAQPVVPAVVVAAPEPVAPVPSLLHSPTNLWGAYGYQWPDGTWTNYIPAVNPWK